MMTNKQIAMGAALGAATFGGLHAAGYSGDSQASIPGTTFSINAEIIKYALTLAAMFLPKLAEKLLPGLGPIVTKLLSLFASKDQPVVAPVPVPSPAPEKPITPCLCDDLTHLEKIAVQLEGTAQDRVVQTMTDLVVKRVKGKPNADKPA
jgi:hypothetical protein